MAGLRVVRQAGRRVEVAEHAEVADVREPRVVERRRADDQAPQPAAEAADPVAELQAVRRELQLADDPLVGLHVAGADGDAQPPQLCGLGREPVRRLGERERLLDGVLEARRGAAEAQARERAAPAAEEHADVVAPRKEAGAADDLSDLRRLVSVRRGGRRLEGTLIAHEHRERPSRSLQLDEELGPLDERAAEPAADEAIADHADPMAEQMPERRDVERFDDPVEALAIALLDGGGELLEQPLILCQLCDRLCETTRIERALGRLRRPGKLKAQEHALFAADPLACQPAAPEQRQLAQRTLVATLVLLLKRAVQRVERRLVLRECPRDDNDAAGTLELGWTTLVGLGGQLPTARRPLGGAFAAAPAVDQTATGSLDGPVLASSPDGQILAAAWVVGDPSTETGRIYASLLGASGQVLGAVALSGATDNASLPAIAIGADGRVAVAWTVTDPDDNGAVQAVHGTLGQPLVTRLLSGGESNVEQPDVAFDAAGVLQVAFTSFDEDFAGRIKVAAETPFGPFAPSRFVSPAGGDVTEASIAPAPGGGLAIAWNDLDRVDEVVVVGVEPAPGVPFSTVAVPGGGPSTSGRLATDPVTGAVTVAWIRWLGETGSALVADREAGGAIGAPQVVSGADDATELDVAYSRASDAAVVWRRNLGTEDDPAGDIRAAVYDAPRMPPPPPPLPPPPPPPLPPPILPPRPPLTLTSLAVDPACIRYGAPLTGTRRQLSFSFVLSEAATVRLQIQRRLNSGVQRRCPSARPRGPAGAVGRARDHRRGVGRRTQRRASRARGRGDRRERRTEAPQPPDDDAAAVGAPARRGASGPDDARARDVHRDDDGDRRRRPAQRHAVGEVLGPALVAGTSGRRFWPRAWLRVPRGKVAGPGAAQDRLEVSSPRRFFSARTNERRMHARADTWASRRLASPRQHDRRIRRRFLHRAGGSVSQGPGHP